MLSEELETFGRLTREFDGCLCKGCKTFAAAGIIRMRLSPCDDGRESEALLAEHQEGCVHHRYRPHE